MPCCLSARGKGTRALGLVSGAILNITLKSVIDKDWVDTTGVSVQNDTLSIVEYTLTHLLVTIRIDKSSSELLIRHGKNQHN